MSCEKQPRSCERLNGDISRDVWYNTPMTVSYEHIVDAWDQRQDLADLQSFLRAQTVKTWAKQLF